MSGDIFGRAFQLTSFGESHGVAIGGVVSGCPPLLELCEEDIQKQLDRRRPGTSRFVTQRRELDRVRILSGLFEGKTTGTPIGFVIENTDGRVRDYTRIADLFRPGHADYTYYRKYGIRDYRGGGRASARETAVRVVAGAIARKYLSDRYAVGMAAYVAQIGRINIDFESFSFLDRNPFFIPNEHQVEEVSNYLDGIRKNLDSVGARINLIAWNVPVGLGEPVYDKLDADLAKALMSINAVKGVEIGDGFSVVSMLGSENNDQMDQRGFLSNHSGGILGGISTGQDVFVSLAVKPTPSIARIQSTIGTDGLTAKISTQGRHDPCVGIRAVPVVEAMVAVTLMDHLLRANLDLT